MSNLPEINLKERVLNVVSQIPVGNILSFSDIAAELGSHPRVVGFVLTGMNQQEMDLYPWHRVVNIKGVVSSLKLGEKGFLQIQKLKDEGFLINELGQIQNLNWWKINRS